MPTKTGRYLQRVGQAHRKLYGQFFTPPAIADFMVNWVLQSGIAQLHDPAFGLGAFWEAAAEYKSLAFTASEIEPRILDFYRAQPGEPNRADVTLEDYLLSWGARRGNVVCNPPYLKFQKFLNRDAVSRLFLQHTGLKLPGHLNVASAFLLKSLAEMDGRGRLAYLMPTEFLNTGYGETVKSRLIEGGHLHSIIQFECEKEVFADATTSVGLILYDASQRFSSVNFYGVKQVDELQRLEHLVPTKTVALADLDARAKWSPYFERQTFVWERSHTVELSYYGRFSRGIATGANSFFVLRPSQAARLGVESECVPCITRSSQIKKQVFCSDDLESMRRADDAALLFCAGQQPSPAALRYIASGESQKIHQRFLTRHRTPWYKTEARASAPLLLGVFSRGGYKVVLNQSDALNLTCYHGFSPNLWGQRYLEHLFLYLHSQVGREILSLSRRKYGDSLDKFEPRDLNTAPVPSPEFFEALSPAQVEEAVAQVERTGVLAGEIEEVFERLRNTNQALPLQPRERGLNEKQNHGSIERQAGN